MSTIHEQIAEAQKALDALRAQAEPTIEEKLAAALDEAQRWQAACADSQAKLAAEVQRTVALDQTGLYVAEVANRSIGVYTSRDVAQVQADGHNAQRSEPNPDNEVHVVTLAEYVQQLEAAVRHVEFLHSEQKRHMKQHFPQAPVSPKSIEQ